ncbi:MAG: 23S rRNA (adenine(2503)-C(2))-methyltransferase RlmN [Chloroflexi bacterium]|jgi:23S rRNA (adenine2503-C2)-methyltransferase|nr:23S rRNA (adenine(2503)-C(2))-methyltransferase RlmN [Chloroflexota bacterium]
MPKPLIYDLDREGLKNLLAEWKQPAFRVNQIWEGIYRNLKSAPEEWSNLPVVLKKIMAEKTEFSGIIPVDRLESSDRMTIKTLFKTRDGQAIEAVLMKYDERRTLCISTQAGCAMGCVFCATGQMGFFRNLTSGEIVEQVLYFARELKKVGETVTNIVIMGMGEPFINYDNTLDAIDRLNDPRGFGLGARRFTISTVGLVPKIQEFTKEKRQVNLAVSLHAANDELRSKLLPINRQYPLSELIPACRDYVETTGRRITFEWALIDNVNDRLEDARELAGLVNGMICHVNVIPLNPTTKFSGNATSLERAQAFSNELNSAGVPCTIRLRRGIDIQAGCGQLAGKHHEASSNSA